MSSPVDGPAIGRRDLLGAAGFAALAGVSAWSAKGFAPTRLYADDHPLGSLKAQVPLVAGAWTGVNLDSIVALSPDVNEALNAAYDDTLSAAYRRADGARVDVALAYVRQVTDSHRVHSPELCYPAQGYRLSDKDVVTQRIAGRVVPITRFVAEAGGGTRERLQFWIVEGPGIAVGNFRQKLKRLQLGARGYVADGLLVRFSAEGVAAEADAQIADLQASLILAMPPQLQEKFLGVAYEAR